jgi:hypothetical protein
VKLERSGIGNFRDCNIEIVFPRLITSSMDICETLYNSAEEIFMGIEHATFSLVISEILKLEYMQNTRILFSDMGYVYILYLIDTKYQILESKIGGYLLWSSTPTVICTH